MIFNTLSASEQQAVAEKRPAYFNKIYSDYGVDTNMNGLYDFIAVKVGINVFTPGNYTVSGSLYDVSGKEIINVTNHVHLSFGAKSVQLKFYGSKSIGPHYLKNLTLLDTNGNPIDHIDEAYIIKKAYYRLEYGPMTNAKLTENYTDYGIDVNGDSLYDFLTIEIGVDVKVPGEYSLMGHLNDFKNREIAWAIDHRNLTKGYHTMHLGFDGKSIGKHSANGPYYLVNATLFSGSSYTGLYICDFIRRAYNTSSYNYSDFRI